jgi:hypothetical protein
MREFLPATWATLVKKGGGKGSDDAAPAAKFNLLAHAPFLLGLAVGMLAISCPGGLAGTGAGKILGLSNAIGDKLLSAGVGGHTTAATRHAAQIMDQYGALVVLLLLVAAFIVRKSLPKPQRRQLGYGAWCGCTIGLSAGAAGITGAVLVPLAEQLGHALGGAV